MKYLKLYEIKKIKNYEAFNISPNDDEEIKDFLFKIQRKINYNL